MTNYDTGIKFYNTECKKQIGNSRLPLQAISLECMDEDFRSTKGLSYSLLPQETAAK